MLWLAALAQHDRYFLTLLLSVVVPAHNRAGDLSTALEALNASDLPRTSWELIVVDDASTDDTSAVAARHADEVLSIAGVAHGPAFARNVGANVATGDVLVFVDSDVAVSRTALSQFASLFEREPDIGAAFGAYDTSPRAPGVVSQYRNLLHHYVHCTNAGRASTFWAGCGAVRRKLFFEVGGFDADRFPRPQMEDIELGHRLVAHGVQIVLRPAIQGTHLKAWTIGTGLVTDFRDRAVPWMRLLLKRGPFGEARELNVQPREKVLTAFAGLSALALLVSPFTGRAFAIISAGCCAIVVAGNAPLLRWFARERGTGFAVMIIPLRMAYYLSNAMAVATAVALHLRERIASE